MRLYEVMLALHPQTQESQQKNFFSQIKKVIKDCSGALHHIDHLGSRPLAHTQKAPRADYFHLSYKALGSAVAEMERIFKINDFVLYFHHERLDSKLSLDKHQENFEQILADSKKREEDRQAHIQAKRKKASYENFKETP